MHLIFRICQTVAGKSRIFLIKSFASFFAILPNCGAQRDTVWDMMEGEENWLLFPVVRKDDFTTRH